MAADQPYKEDIEEAWTRLRRHLDRADGFWLGFVFASDVRVVDTLAGRASWNRRRRAAPFLRIAPRSPRELATIVDRLEVEAPGPPGCTWLEAVHAGTDTLTRDSWDEAWTTCLQSLNHRRDTLRRRLGGLVLAAPPDAKRTAMTVSTDLWSIRDFLTQLAPTGAPGIRGPEPARMPQDTTPDRRVPAAPYQLTGGTERTATDHEALLTLLAASDDALIGPWRARLATALDAASSRDDDQATGLLLLRRGSARLRDDPAGARDDLARAANVTQDDRIKLTALDRLFGLTMRALALDDAERTARQAVEIAERLADQLATPEALRDLSVSLDNLGRVHEAQGDWAAAATDYGRSLDLAERLADQLATPEALRDLSVSLNNLGRVHQSQGDWAAARARLVRAAQVLEELVRADVAEPGDDLALAGLHDRIRALDRDRGSPSARKRRRSRTIRRRPDPGSGRAP